MTTLAAFCSAYCTERLDLSALYAADMARTATRLDQWAKRPLKSLDVADVAAWLRSLRQAGLSAVSANNRRRQALTLITEAARQGIRPPINPAMVPRCREPQPEPTAWTAAEVQRLVAIAAEWPKRPEFWAALVLTTYYTGERIGAVLQARWDRLRPPLLSLAAESRKQRRGRTYLLPPDCLEAIEELPHGQGTIFAWPCGRRHFYRVFGRIVQRAGLLTEPSVGKFHKLRRTSGTLVELAGGDGARHLGHSRGIFERRYFCAAVGLLVRASLPPQLTIH